MARHRVRPSTFGKYTSRVAKITATLGVKPARSVKAEHVARWQSELLRAAVTVLCEATTAGYVRSLGERPMATVATAAAMLDPRSQSV